jgi:hypothetical protein
MLKLPERMRPLAVLQEVTHQLPVNVFAQWIHLKNSLTSANRFIKRSLQRSVSHQLRQGVKEAAAEALAFALCPVIGNIGKQIRAIDTNAFSERFNLVSAQNINGTRKRRKDLLLKLQDIDLNTTIDAKAQSLSCIANNHFPNVGRAGRDAFSQTPKGGIQARSAPAAILVFPKHLDELAATDASAGRQSKDSEQCSAARWKRVHALRRV